ncbi:MAG: M48 family metallopeptidase [Fidelibacterota bacterium]
MAELKIITLPEVGDVLLERSYRAKHIIISVKPPSKIRVAVPVGVNFEKARKFAEQREYWIEKQLAKFSNSTAIPILDSFAGEELVAHKKYLTKRVDDLAKQHDFKYNKLRFKVMKTRWGSCTAKNNISLNILMTHISKRLQDYIILHELVHTRIKNHGNHFWALMDRMTGDAKATNKELKEKYTLYK